MGCLGPFQGSKHNGRAKQQRSRRVDCEMSGGKAGPSTHSENKLEEGGDSGVMSSSQENRFCNPELSAKIRPGTMGVGFIPMTRDGVTVYYTQQKVCDFHVLVTAAQLGIERVGDKDVHVEVLDRTILIRATSSGAAHVKGQLWGQADPLNSKWVVTDLGLKVTIRKHRSSYGSWLHLLKGTSDCFGFAVVSPEASLEPHQHLMAEKAAEIDQSQEMNKESLSAFLEKFQSCMQQPVPKVAFLFPGQGAQSVGMLSQAQGLLPVQKMNAIAYEVLGYNLLELCLHGPQEKLNQTQFAQPAMLMADLAAVEVLKSTGREHIIRQCSAVAGLSLGEWAALVFARAISFADALRCIKIRGETMAMAASAGAPQAMFSCAGLPVSEVAVICDIVSGNNAGVTCQVANHLFPDGCTISGHSSAVREAAQMAMKAGALRTREIPVAGAFHTELMLPAAKALRAVISTIQIKDPRMPVMSNVTGEPMTSAAEIEALLPRQVCEGVLWEKSIRRLAQDGWTRLFELGPGGQLLSISKKIDPVIGNECVHVSP